MLEQEVIVQNLLASFIVVGEKAAAKTPVVFLHGWGSSKAVWERALGGLGKSGVASYAIDLPGFGKTEVPKEPWNVARYAEFVLDFLKKLEIQRAIVVGHSFGGRVGIVLAALHGECVHKLVLVDSAGIHTTPRFKKLLAFGAKFVRPFFRLRWTQPLRKKIYRRLGAEDYVATPALQKTFVQVIGEDLTNYLARVSQPTLLIWGKNDFVTPLSYARHFLNHLPQATLEILDGAGHYSFLDQPEEFSKILLPFVNK